LAVERLVEKDKALRRAESKRISKEFS